MPTPTAPPSTPSAVRSMPAADSATTTPSNNSKARNRFAAILRIDRLSVAPASSFFSSAADTHSASTITSTADTAPSIRLRTLILVLPIFQVMSSSSCSTSGSTPVIHSTTATQASHDTLRSTTRMKSEFGKARCSTRATRRMTTSDTSTGTTTLNTANGTVSSASQCRPQRTATANSRASTGNSTPPTTPSPNHTEPGCAVGPRSSRTMAQARPRQPTARASSINTPERCNAASKGPRSRACQDVITALQATAASTRRCAATLRASALRL